MEYIPVPDLAWSNALGFCLSLSKLNDRETNKVRGFDFEGVKFFYLFTMLIVSSMLRRLREQYACRDFDAINCNNTYAQHMAFFCPLE
ncbi:MAG: hypothetical protein N2315_02200 [Thermanaerothrix sp.]|nr:hypothetical protein [Thermanaerothrix sp.]